jgi:hypothetical protein
MHIALLPTRIDKCLGLDQIFGHLKIRRALIDSATDLKKHPLFSNIARCYQTLISLRNTLGLLQWGTRNEIPRFIEFVMGFVQLTMTLPKPYLYRKYPRVRKKTGRSQIGGVSAKWFIFERVGQLWFSTMESSLLYKAPVCE